MQPLLKTLKTPSDVQSGEAWCVRPCVLSPSPCGSGRLCGESREKPPGGVSRFPGATPPCPSALLSLRVTTQNASSGLPSPWPELPCPQATTLLVRPRRTRGRAAGAHRFGDEQTGLLGASGLCSCPSQINPRQHPHFPGAPYLHIISAFRASVNSCPATRTKGQLSSSGIILGGRLYDWCPPLFFHAP